MRLEEVKLLLLSIVLVALLLSSCKSGQDPPVAVVSFVDPLPHSGKGYELYSWRVGRVWYFTLATGTNRLKTYHEITSDENVAQKDGVRITIQEIYGLEAALDQLPPDTGVVWMGPKALKQIGVKPVDLALPSRRTIQEIEAYCAQLDIQLQVTR